MKKVIFKSLLVLVLVIVIAVIIICGIIYSGSLLVEASIVGSEGDTLYVLQLYGNGLLTATHYYNPNRHYVICPNCSEREYIIPEPAVEITENIQHVVPMASVVYDSYFMNYQEQKLSVTQMCSILPLLLKINTMEQCTGRSPVEWNKAVFLTAGGETHHSDLRSPFWYNKVTYDKEYFEVSNYLTHKLIEYSPIPIDVWD